MVKEFLTRDRADTSAENGEKQESVFADTPFFADCAILIYPESDKGEEIQDDKYCNEVIHKSIIRS